MIINLFKKLSTLICSDFTKTEYFRAYSQLVQSQQLFVHNLIFFLTCTLACLYYFDVYVMDAVLSLSIIDFFGFDSRFKQEVIEGKVLAFYFAMTLINIALSILCALYFYIRYGHLQEIGEFMTFYFHGYFIPFLTAVIMLPFAVAIFWFGTILIGIKFFQATGVDQIVSVIVLQVLILAKGLAFCSVGIAGFFQIWMPFKLHPLRFINLKCFTK